MMAIDMKQLNEAVKAAPTDRESAALDKARAVSRRTQALLAAAGMEGPERRWYVLTIAPGSDKAVEKQLSDAKIECWMPVKTISRKRRGGRAGLPMDDVQLPALPGYLFVHVYSTVEGWAGLRTVPGVSGVLGGADRPASVSEARVLKLKAFIDEDPAAIAVLTNALVRGATVMIDSGPFAMFTGMVSGAPTLGRVIVEVMLLGRAVPIDLELALVSKT